MKKFVAIFTVFVLILCIGSSALASEISLITENYEYDSEDNGVVEIPVIDDISW